MNIKVTQALSVIFLAATAVFIWQTVNVYPQIAILQDNIETQEAVIRDSEDLLERLKELVIFTDDNKEGIKKFDLILPASVEKENLLSNLDSLASANGLNILKISFDVNGVFGTVTGQKKADYDSKNIKMVMRGSYPSFKNFLVAVEKNLRALDVVSVDFSEEVSSGSKKAEGERKTYSFVVGLKTYLQKPAREEDVFKLLSIGKFKNFTVKQLNFIKGKTFSDLPLSSEYNINTGVGEIGNPDIF